MITGKLKNLIFSRRIKKALRRDDFRSELNSGKIGLIIDAENAEDKKSLFQIYNDLDFEQQDLKIVICGTEVIVPEGLNADVLDPKEISTKGDFKSEVILKFKEENFDFLVCHFSKPSKAGCLLAAETKATVKIGNSPDDYGIYDVEIDAQEISVFQQEIIKYIKIFKKNS